MMLHTQRLVARPLCLEDFHDLCRLHENSQVMEFVGGVRTEETKKSWLQENLRHWTAHEFGIWIFHHPAEDAFVGRCGLRRVQVSGVDEVELGYSLMPQYWGKGLATEMATAMLAVGFDHLGLPSVIAMTYAGNGRSRRVAEKLGFQFERETAWKGSQAMLYRKTPERLPKHDL